MRLIVPTLLAVWSVSASAAATSITRQASGRPGMAHNNQT